MLSDRELGSEWDNEKEIENQPSSIDESKMMFVVFSSIGVTALTAVILLVWYFINPRLLEIGYNLDKIVMTVFLVFISGVIINHLLVVFSAIFEKNFMLFNLRNGIIESYLFAFSLRLGRLFGISKDRIGNSFVKVNNSLVKARVDRVKKQRLLVLLPRCMQDSDCKQKIIEDINNCKDCGKCDITEFKKMSKTCNFYTHVATGGTLARKKIKEYRPSVILAVACERELVSGINDVGSIPVIGLPNERVEGPCKNTKADIENVRQVVKFLINEKVNSLTEEEVKLIFQNTKVKPEPVEPEVR